MSRNADAEDLLVRARRDCLAEDDERRLELSLDASRELALLYEAGVGFDAEASLRPGDEARAGRLVARTMQELRLQPARRPRVRSSARYFALSVACGVLLSVAAASAWQYANERWFSAPRLEAPARDAAPRALQLRLPESRAGSVAAVPSEAAPPEATPALQRARSPVGKPLVTGGATPPPSPLALFTRAAEARRRGDVAAAIALYEELGLRYPDSVEAQDARLLLGNLRLEQRAPRAALNQFERYGGGPLSLEALWGKAEALRKLHSPEERAVLEQLLREYPSSPYSGAAQKRLQQLSP